MEVRTATLPPGDKSPRFPITLLGSCRKDALVKEWCNDLDMLECDCLIQGE